MACGEDPELEGMEGIKELCVEMGKTLRVGECGNGLFEASWCELFAMIGI